MPSPDPGNSLPGSGKARRGQVADQRFLFLTEEYIIFSSFIYNESMSKPIQTSRHPGRTIPRAGHFVAPLARSLAAGAALALLTACASLPSGDRPPADGNVLRSSLPVAAAALGAGQHDVARRLYRSLAKRFANAPEPVLGLGYTEFLAGRFADAQARFAHAAELAGASSALMSEALLGAGRSALASGNPADARAFFRRALDLGGEVPPEAVPWIRNGLAVASTLDTHPETAEMSLAVATAQFEAAIRLSSEDPRIVANHVRMLVAAGRIDEAQERYHARPASFWQSEDGPALARLLGSPEPPASEPAPGDPEPNGATVTATPVVDAPRSDPPDSSPANVVNLTLGQSRRLRIGDGATAVSVADPGVADVQLLAPNAVYIIGRGVGRTSIAVLVDRTVSEERIVSVNLDLAPLRAVLAADPAFRNVDALPFARGVALVGEVASSEAAARALRRAEAILPEGVPVENDLRIADPLQVNLEVQIAEVSRSVSETLGFNWEAFQNRSVGNFGLQIGRPALGIGSSGTGASFGFRRESNRSRFVAVVDALATAGLANILARPNLTAISGEAASFFSGGEFPMPTGFQDGVLSFQYKQFGILLDFVPTVVESGRIVLTVRPEVSSPSESTLVGIATGVTVPIVNVRRAETTVEVGDGESIVIAGLFRSRTNTHESGVPGIKDIHTIGALFGTSTSLAEELELIVIVTARLVQANAAPDADDAVRPGGSRRAGGYHY